MGGAGRRSEARLPTNLVPVISRNVRVAVNCSFLVLCYVFVNLFLLLHQPVFLFVPAFYWFLFLHGIGPNKNVVYISFFGEVLLSWKKWVGPMLTNSPRARGILFISSWISSLWQASIVLLCGTVICKWFRTLRECNIVRDMKHTTVSTVVPVNSQ